MRVLCHAQHLSGVGHFVRTHALACGLAEAHDVVLIDGGLPVPRHPGPAAMKLLPLPRIRRRGGVLTAIDPDRPLAAVLEERIARLVAAVDDLRPDVLLVEHYPWSKWELEDEILATIRIARERHPAVRVVCSLRDIAPRTRHEAVGDEVYEDRVLDRLSAHFDAVLVHADPRFTRLEEHFGAARRLPVPWAYTGFVNTAGIPEASTDGGLRGEAADAATGSPYAVLSAGAGADAGPFLLAASEAFRRLSSAGELGGIRLLIFAGMSMGVPAVEALRAHTRGVDAVVLPFSPEFPALLRRAALSISRAGYNTCVDLLGAGVPAVLVPHPRMSDQRARAERMRAHGLATVVLGDPPDVEALVAAIRTARATPPAVHGLALRGVEETRARVEELHHVGTLAGVRAREDSRQPTR